jgi:hypothetical protein
MIRQSAQVSTFPPVTLTHLHLESEACPACGQDIPADKLEEITGRISAHEREKARVLSERLEGEHTLATAQAQAKAKADLEEERRQSAQRESTARETAKSEAESAAALILAEYKRDQEQTRLALNERIEAAETAQRRSEADRANLQTRLNESAEALEVERKNAQARETLVREEERNLAKVEADYRVKQVEDAKQQREQDLLAQVDAASALKKSSQEEAAELRSRLESTSAAHQQELAKNKEEMKAEIQRVRKIATDQAEASLREEISTHQQTAAHATQKATQAEAKVESLVQEHEATLAKELGAQREILEKDAEKKLNAQMSRGFEEKLKLTDKLADLQREVDRKTNEELGEGAEVDVFEALKAEFPDDKIKRIPKGTPGADIHHTIVVNGKQCGTILYDSKNHKQYRSEHVSKLKSDQIAAKADHSILSTRKFPEGKGQLILKDGVILVNPARVVAIATIVRLHLIQLDSLRSSEIEREKKTEALYEFITSEQCCLLLDRIDTKAACLLKLQEVEMKWHNNHWNKEGEALRDIQKAKADLAFSITSIIGATGDSDEHADEATEEIPW